MKIAIDIREAQLNKTGKGWYTFNLVNELLKVDRNNSYILYSNSNVNPYAAFKNAIFKNISAPGLKWHFAVLKDLKKTRPDLFFSPTSYIIPALAPNSLPVIITVHDLVAFLFPYSHNLKAVLAERLFLPWAIKKTRGIFVVSENTKKDLLKRFDCHLKNIQLTYCAISDIFREPVNPEKLKQLGQKLKLPKHFILSVGTLEPRKNLGVLIKSLSIIKKRLPQYKLVIVGKRGWKWHQIEKNIKRYKLENDIILTGYLDTADLQKIYTLAAVFVFPSLYEGFGIPPLEAMACGCPVISSNSASLPEVIGDAGMLVEPHSVRGLANAVINMIEDDKLRSMFVERGKHRVLHFNWQNSAKIAFETFRTYCAP